jgi:hypothetical protein
VKMRLEPADDLLHPLEEASNFNESRYYNFFDAGAGLGGWVRMGNRPNEGYAELTVCLYLPDGRVGFIFKRPEITGHTAHDAGGLRFEVVEPFVEHRVTYDGRVLLLTEPRVMVDPRQAFADNPRVPCTIDLTHRAAGRVFGGEPEWDDDEERPDVDPEKAFARGHTEQHMRVSGTVVIDGETYTLTDGLGMRDHSWGPRSWQAVWWYRWLTGNCGPELGFAMTVAGDQQGGVHTHGFLYDVARYGDDRLVPIRGVELASTYDDEWYHRSLHARVRTDDRTYELDGTVWSNIPLRNRRQAPSGEMLTTRIAEGMTTWSCDGVAGSGLAEYLDQVVDGVPVGTRVGM